MLIAADHVLRSTRPAQSDADGTVRAANAEPPHRSARMSRRRARDRSSGTGAEAMAMLIVRAYVGFRAHCARSAANTPGLH